MSKDEANIPPAAVLLAVALVWLFEAALFGDAIASTVPSYPTFPSFQECQLVQSQGISFFGLFQVPGTDALVSVVGLIGCFVGQTVRLVFAVFQALGVTVLLFLNLTTFNIPGAPIEIRSVVTLVLVGTLVWSVSGLLRGGGAS